MKTKGKELLKIGMNMILIIALVSFIIISSNLKSTKELYEVILKADSNLLEISVDGQKAESYYEEASYAYEDMDYKEVERNCRLAREYYYEESQGYRKVKAELKDKETDNKLIVLYIEKLDLLSEITDNMFEACEYFESAARYYYVYYDTGVPSDDMSYDMGTGEIDRMGEKILAHDEAVKKYNNVLEEFRFELEKRLK